MKICIEFDTDGDTFDIRPGFVVELSRVMITTLEKIKGVLASVPHPIRHEGVVTDSNDQTIGRFTLHEPCECEMSHELVPGVLFPFNSDLDIAGVERCDMCKRYETDEDAAMAIIARHFLDTDYTFREFPDVTSLDGEPVSTKLALYQGERRLTFDEGMVVFKTLRAHVKGGK